MKRLHLRALMAVGDDSRSLGDGVLRLLLFEIPLGRRLLRLVRLPAFGACDIARH